MAPPASVNVTVGGVTAESTVVVVVDVNDWPPAEVLTTLVMVVAPGLMVTRNLTSLKEPGGIVSSIYPASSTGKEVDGSRLSLAARPLTMVDPST